MCVMVENVPISDNSQKLPCKSPKIQINILPVLSGDCIHLRFQSFDGWHNVIVDSGPAGAAETFRTLLQQIALHGECVDLLCFSHIDNDHIKGAERVFSSPGFDSSIIHKIWLNIPPSMLSANSKSAMYRPETVETACQLWNVLYGQDISCETCVASGMETIVGDMQIIAVLPTLERLLNYYSEWEHQTRSLHYHPMSVQQDTNPINGSSITLLCTIGQNRLLFAGDAFSCDLAAVGTQYAGESGFSIVKLPHHGSDANITTNMLTELRCREFIISGRQNRYRPSPEAMALLSNYGATTGEVTVYGNYDWPRFSAGVPNVTIVHPTNLQVMTVDKIEVFSDASSTKLFTE